MTLGNKLSKLRRENNYTQEQLSDILGVSRQAISKWESDVTYPETDKLIKIGELYNCSLDYLLKDSILSNDNIESEDMAGSQASSGIYLSLRPTLHDKKSEKTVWGMPLWHIGKNAKGFFAIGLKATGVVAIGVRAKGVVSIGVLSLGFLSLGTLSLGALSIGLFSLGLLSLGCFAAGILSLGAISFGIITLGAMAIGDFSVGALAIGKHLAIGDHASALVALGKTKATGDLLQITGDISGQDYQTAIMLLEENVPSYLLWAVKFLKHFL